MFKHGINNKGVSVVEYALLAALIGTASVLAVTTFGTQTASLFERENLRLAESNVGGDNGSGGSTGSGDGLGDHRATQNLDMSLFRIVNINDPLNPSDAATKGYVDTAVASISMDGDDLGNHTATQNLDLATNRIVNLGAPQDPADATTKAYVDAAVAGVPGGDNLGDHTATQNIALANNWLSADGSNSGIRISPEGNVGIGIDNPSSPLTVRASSDSIATRLHGRQGDNFSAIVFDNAAGNAGASVGFIQHAPGSHLAFATQNTERMRITDNGDLGIGGIPNLSFQEISGNKVEIFSSPLGTGSGSRSSPLMLRSNVGGNLSALQFSEFRTSSNSSSHSTSEHRIQRVVDITRMGYIGLGSDYLTLGTGNLERLRITDTGRVGINTTNPTQNEPFSRLTIGGNDSVSIAQVIENDGIGQSALVWRRNGGTASRWTMYLPSGSTEIRLFHSGTGDRAVFQTSGNLAIAGQYTQFSDARLKDNISSLDYGLSEILELRPVHYTWRDGDTENSGRQVGLIAQEVQRLIPEIVSAQSDEAGTKTVSYSSLVPVLIRAVQELKIQNDNMRAHISTLESRIDAEIDSLRNDSRPR